MNNNELLNCLIEGIKDFILYFQNGENFYNFVYEADYQSFIYCNIYKKLEQKGLLYSDNKSILCNDSNHIKGLVRNSIIHCEQKITNKANESKAIDIAIWDPSDKNKNKDYTEKDCLILIEIKNNCIITDVYKRLVKDNEKLLNLINEKKMKYGVCLSFVYNDNKLIEKLKEISINDFCFDNVLNSYVITPNKIYKYIDS